LATWLGSHSDWFTEQDARIAVIDSRAALPPQLFVDPELRRNAGALVAAALPLMQGWNILLHDGERYRLTAERRHPQFPFVDDIIAYQAAFLEETIENAAYAQRYAR
jgi:hypothetical protein